MVQAARNGTPPLSTAVLRNFVEGQKKDHPVLNGRPYNNRDLPIGVYAAPFDDFRHALSTDQNFQEEPEFLANITALMLSATNVYRQKLERTMRMTDILARLINVPLEEEAARSRSNSNAVGTFRMIGQPPLTADLVVVEVMDEIGQGGCDPSIQGVMSYAVTVP